MKQSIVVFMACILSFVSIAVCAGRDMEMLDRGVLATRCDDESVFVSWRLLVGDADDVAFDIFRVDAGGKELKLNSTPVSDVTFFVDKDEAGKSNIQYQVRPHIGADPAAPSAPFTLKSGTAQPYFSIPIAVPAGYHANDGSAADLDGDGQYDLVLKLENRSKDNSQSGETDPVYLDGLKFDGTRLWRIDLGKNIRAGAHYTQFMVYDLDGDGFAEVACKTAPGTMDGLGKPVLLGKDDPAADYRNAEGRINAGPEYLTVFDGRTGAQRSTVPYTPSRGISTNDPTPERLKEIWGDGRGNRSDRFLACVAYLDGVHPSLVMCRGYYTRTFLSAWDFKDGQLQQRWIFDSDLEGKQYAGQGNHNLSVADVDDDGKDEIIYGGMVVDDNGHGLFSTGLGHGDAMHVSDLAPENPGLEMVRIQERFDDAGLHMIALKTGKILWKIPSVKAATSGGDKGEGPGRGVSFDVDPRFPGTESWAAGAGMSGMFDSTGKRIAPVEQGETVNISRPSCNFGIWWDGDELRELLDKTHIDKWDYAHGKMVNILDSKTYGCVSNNGTKANPVLSGDLFGDWREEVIWATEDQKELRVFSTNIPTNRRMITLMQDPEYRLSMVWQNTAYNQPPHPDFFIGHGMSQPPKPNISIIKPKKGAR